MSYVLKLVVNLTYVDNIPNSVTNIVGMFHSCVRIKNIPDLYNITVTNMKSTFERLYKFNRY